MVEQEPAESGQASPEKTQLEAAPEAAVDVRVPLAERMPAVKRRLEDDGKDSGNGGKWQTVEVEDRKRESEQMIFHRKLKCNFMSRQKQRQTSQPAA